MFHHVPFKGIVDMSVQMNPSVKMIFEAWNRVVTQYHFPTVVFCLDILIDLYKQFIELAVMPAIMITFDQDLLAISCSMIGVACFGEHQNISPRI